MYALTLSAKRTACLQNKLQTATYTEFQTRSLRLSEIPFFIFPAKDSLKNPYKDAMVNAFWKNSKKSIFLLLYGRYRIIRKLNPAFVSHQKLKKILFMLYYGQKFLLRKNNMALYSCLRVTFLCLAGIFFLFTLLFSYCLIFCKKSFLPSPLLYAATRRWCISGNLLANQRTFSQSCTSVHSCSSLPPIDATRPLINTVFCFSAVVNAYNRRYITIHKFIAEKTMPVIIDNQL